MSDAFSAAAANAFEIREFSDRALLDAALADSVSASLAEGLDARAAASLVVSGGSTPKGFFQQLQTASLDWGRLTVTLADDRWVPPAHDDSNERLVRENLLLGAAADAEFLPLVTEDAHPVVATREVSERLAPLSTFDVMVLGMGGDGHFASLFPESDVLGDGLDLNNSADCIAVDPPHAPHARMSMTLRRILDARRVILHIVGDDKRKVLERAVAEGDPLTLPAASLASSQPKVELYWAP